MSVPARDPASAGRTSGLRGRALDGLMALLVGLGAFVLYLKTLAPTVLQGDSGEFQFVPYILGVAHPTGYPLYLLLGWAWSHLVRIGDVAYRMNLFSAFAAALAVGLLVPTTLALLRQALPGIATSARRPIALLTACAFAVSPTFWSQAVVAEVYGLHILLLLLIFYLMLTWCEARLSAGAVESGPAGAYRRLLLAALLFGLSLAHHRTTLLLLPALAAYVWLVDRRVFWKRRVVLRAAGLAALPLLLYLYVPWRAPSTPYLSLPLAQGRSLVLYQNTAAGFVNYLLGGPFGGSVDLSVDLGARLAMAGRFLHAEATWVGLALALLGLLRLVAGRRWALLAWSGCAFLFVVGFNLVYTIGDIIVLFIPAFLILALWSALGVGALAEGVAWLLRRAGARSALLAGGAVVLPLLALTLWAAAERYALVDQSRNTQARARWQAILAQPIPEGAILISNDRDEIMPLWYFQTVGEGQPLRPDLLGLFPLITPEQPTLGSILELAWSSGRPTYLIKEMPGVEIKAQVKAEGNLWRVVGMSAAGEPARRLGVSLEGEVSLVGWDRSPHSPRPGEALQVSLFWEALRPLEADYHSYVHLLDSEGRKLAQSDRQPGGVYYPSSAWLAGERLRDEHLLPIPADLQPGVYRLLAGMYTLSGEGEIGPLGEPVPIGPVAVKDRIATEPGPIQHRASANWDDQLELLGFDLSPQAGALLVRLHWRCLRPPAADYTVFVHLLDASGETLSQHDSQPQGGSYPLSVCDAGEVLGDEHRVPLPAVLPPGPYRLRVGLYLPESGERLPLTGGGDALDLGPVELGE